MWIYTVTHHTSLCITRNSLPDEFSTRHTLTLVLTPNWSAIVGLIVKGTTKGVCYLSEPESGPAAPADSGRLLKCHCHCAASLLRVTASGSGWPCSYWLLACSAYSCSTWVKRNQHVHIRRIWSNVSISFERSFWLPSPKSQIHMFGLLWLLMEISDSSAAECCCDVHQLVYLLFDVG